MLFMPPYLDKVPLKLFKLFFFYLDRIDAKVQLECKKRVLVLSMHLV